MVEQQTSPAIEGVRTNDEVKVKGMEDNIGTGVVQGFTNDGGLPIVRFMVSKINKQGERYLQSKKCLTGSGKHSRLYVISQKELTVRRYNGAKRANTQSTE